MLCFDVGHGGEVRDPTRREPSGYNQTIVTSDNQRIKDSEIFERLVKKLPSVSFLRFLLLAS